MNKRPPFIGSDHSQSVPQDYYSYIRTDILADLPNHFKPATILDVGCGTGATTAYLKQFFDAEYIAGVEINHNAAVKARESLDRVYEQSIESTDLKLPENTFDLILFLDVIEHLYDPWTVLTRVRRACSETGMIVLSIPNIQHWRAVLKIVLNKWEYTQAGILDRTHIRFFTLHTIQDMVHRSSLTIERLHCSMGPETKILNSMTLSLFRNILTFRYLVYLKK
jgi:2-polyprenyl-3-methyl-5-hydroxy-6-metoxy-1,4-benzoquinol methylase